MTLNFQDYLKSRGLKLKKVIENNNRSLTLVLKTEDENDQSAIEEELGPYFGFANGIMVQLEKESKSQQDVFSLDEYQKKKLDKRNKEISEFKPAPKVESDYVLHPGELICGRTIKEEPRSIESIDFTETVHESGVCIEGDVFSQEVKEISDKSELFTIALTDYTGSIYLKHFNQKSKEKLRSLLKKYTQPGNRIKVLGSLEYDDFLSATRTV